jgi:hypothetical protein
MDAMMDMFGSPLPEVCKGVGIVDMRGERGGRRRG